jgi:hypothetical protein
MDGYGIQIHTERLGTTRYRGPVLAGEPAQTWELAEAEEIAYQLLQDRNAVYATFGNGEHEFRMWRDNVTNFTNFDFPGVRWSEWYVDVEINEHRWRYRPCADLSEEDIATDTAAEAHELAEVTTIWVGISDTGEEFETDSAN